MPVTARQFLEYAQHHMDLHVETPDHFLGRVIREEAINRPGLALGGFFHYFANKRIQVLGLAEMTYLKSLSREERYDRLKGVFDHHIPCVVLTRNRRPFPEILRLCKSYRVPLLRTSLITSRFVNLATLAMENLTPRVVKVSGTMLDILGIGVLIEGSAGIGKSEAALGLIERGHSLVSDDQTYIRQDARGSLVCTASDLTRYHMEIRGLGIINVPSLFGMASVTKEKTLELIVSLYPPDPRLEGDRSGLSRKTRKVLDLEIPLVELPVAPGRDMAGVIEVAAMNQKLANLGHDAAKEFDDRMVAALRHRSQNPSHSAYFSL